MSRISSTRLISRCVSTLLAVTMATAPSVHVFAQTSGAQQAVRQGVGRSLGIEPAPEGPDAQPLQTPHDTPPADHAAGQIDTRYITPTAAAVVVLRPAQLLTAPMAEMFPTEVASAAGLKYLGFAPADVDEIVAFVDQINPLAPPGYGLTVKFNKPFRGSAIPAEFRAHTQLAELAGKRYLQSQDPMLPSFYGVDNQTLLVASDATLRQLIESSGQARSGPIIDRLRNAGSGHDLYVAVELASLRPFIEMGLMQARAEMPPELQKFLTAPSLIAAAELTLNFTRPGPMGLAVHANDEAAAGQLESLVQEALALYREQMTAEIGRQAAASDDPVELAMARYLERVSHKWTEPFQPERDGASLVFFRSDGRDPTQTQLTNVAVIGILVALLLPAVQAAREAARRNQSMNNLKQLIIALMNYHDVKGSFPAHGSYGPDGRPLLSWRVHILPYLEEEALYREFRLDEPWDSEHNRQLIARIPEALQNPNLPSGGGKTNYLAVVGEQCIFDGTPKGLSFRDITDGSSKTIMLVEASPDRAVEWTKPDDWQYDPNNATAGLGGVRPDGWLAAFADGHIEFISEYIDPSTFSAMLTRGGGEIVGAHQFP